MYVNSDFHAVPQLTEGIHEMRVTIGEQANFSCSGLSFGREDIGWTVDGTVYERCSAENNTDICFENSYTSNTTTIRSTLIIPDRNSLGVGSHTVQCTMYTAVQGNPSSIGSSTAFLHVEAAASEFHSFSLGGANYIVECVCHVLYLHILWGLH